MKDIKFNLDELNYILYVLQCYFENNQSDDCNNLIQKIDTYVEETYGYLHK